MFNAAEIFKDLRTMRLEWTKMFFSQPHNSTLPSQIRPSSFASQNEKNDKHKN